MRKFHSIAALRGDGLRPQLQALLIGLQSIHILNLFTRPDGMLHRGLTRSQDEVVLMAAPKRVA